MMSSSCAKKPTPQSTPHPPRAEAALATPPSRAPGSSKARAGRSARGRRGVGSPRTTAAPGPTGPGGSARRRLAAARPASRPGLPPLDGARASASTPRGKTASPGGVRSRSSRPPVCAAPGAGAGGWSRPSAQGSLWWRRRAMGARPPRPRGLWGGAGGLAWGGSRRRAAA
jgi:hypothetical protein